MQDIPLIDIIGTYSKEGMGHVDAYHYDSLPNLASFFGRTMSAHRHDHFYQFHFVNRGEVTLHLGCETFQLIGPLFFLTPPLVPHAFTTEEDADGHVLTIHQTFLRQLFHQFPASESMLQRSPYCVVLSDLATESAAHFQRMNMFLLNMRYEHSSNLPYRQEAMRQWLQLLFIELIRLINEPIQSISFANDPYTELFRTYSELINNHFHQHLLLKEYATRLNITEAKLNEVCRSVIGTSAKKMVYSRLMQEAEYYLIYTDLPIMKIADQLGFSDPSYFSAFFARHVGESPQLFRQRYDARLGREYYSALAQN